ncbi:scoloptoxin SSD14-like isoform X2 [Sitodiplosis mosellana]|uniref:scoloptoxin SSD14-like isoform X2 n=1 Tax=Sitodiplosis mosellana TaxID=263140 RepID=UPI0024450884|nr:scoloptoxin SSD14-like isoform X2 [Sitodiplosis mosellana]
MAKVILSIRKKLLLAVVSAAVAGALLTAVIFYLKWEDDEVTHQTAVVTNGLECSAIAGKILKKGGSVADAAIAALLCEGVTCPQSTGLGGGFVMTIYIKEANKVETLIARDVAPLAATEEMFVNTTVTGGKAVAVPGELMGYYELHQKYGKLNWSDLFDPTIELCRKGHMVSPYLANILKKNKKKVEDSPTLAEVYIDPTTNDVYKEGDYITRNKLADTLEIIKNEGVGAIYNNGSIGRAIIEDIQDAGGIMTIEDLMQYKVRWETPISVKVMGNKTLHTLPLPGSGAMVAFIMNVLNDYLPRQESVVSMQRIAEVFKFAYAERTKLGDGRFYENALKVVQNLTSIDFATEIRKKIEDNKTYQDYAHYGANFSSETDHGTAHINILAPNGDAISATGTINTLFGCKIISKTGIILNDGMDDFAVPGKDNAYGIPPSPANFITPQKMPLSSMSPTILIDEHRNVQMLIGAAGGSKITSSVAYVLLRYLYFNESITDAVTAPRIHHQLAPMQLEYEQGIPDDIVKGLRDIGHVMYEIPPDSGFASLTAIAREGKKLVPVYDHRRKGSIEVS